MPGCCPGAPAQRLSWKIPAKSLQLGTLGNTAVQLPLFSS